MDAHVYESETGRFESFSRDPAPHLKQHVSAYWGYEERSTQPVARLELPYPEVVVIVAFETLRVDGEPHGSFVAATHESVARTEHDGFMSGIEFSLTPVAARMLFGVPMHELASRVVPLEHLFAHADLLAERLYETPSWATRFDLLEHALASRLAGAQEPQREATWAWQRLAESQGRLQVAALTDELGWSRKRLVASFRDHVGLAPKAFARVLRFRRALTRLREGAELGEVALDAGYYDQAHFNRDFRRFAGMTPTEYVRRLSPDDPGVPD